MDSANFDGIIGSLSGSWSVELILPHIFLFHLSWHCPYVDNNDINDILSISWMPVGTVELFDCIKFWQLPELIYRFCMNRQVQCIWLNPSAFNLAFSQNSSSFL